MTTFLSISVLFLVCALIYYVRQHRRLPKYTDSVIEDIMEKPLPEHMPGEKGMMEKSGIRICYERIKSASPSGDTVFLLHGLSQTLLDIPESLYDPLLNAGYDVIRMDHRGGGESSWLTDWSKDEAYSLEHMAQDVISVMDHLEVGKCHLIGISMGGMIAQQISCSYKERVLSLTSIMSSGYYHDPKLTGIPLRFMWGILWINILYARDLTNLKNKLKLHLAIQYLLMGGKSNMLNDRKILQKAAYEINQRRGYSITTQNQHSEAIKISGSRYDQLEKLGLPALIVHGTADPLVLFDHGKKCAELIPGAESLFIADMRHFLSDEYSEIIANRITEFYQKIPSTPATI